MDEQYTNTFKALSDTTRLKIVWLLSNIDSKVCVSEIMEVLCEQQYNVSRHLNILKKANIISEKRKAAGFIIILISRMIPFMLS